MFIKGVERVYLTLRWNLRQRIKKQTSVCDISGDVLSCAPFPAFLRLICWVEVLKTHVVTYTKQKISEK